MAQANLLYLRKTFPDTATALENFDGGITTASIETKTTTDDLNIGTTNLGIINIGTDINRFSDINIGGYNCSLISPNRIATSELDCVNSGGALTIANSMTDGQIIIGPNITNGLIFIGVSDSRTTSSIIHIGDSDNLPAGASVHINNGLNTASNVQILNGTGST